MSVQRGYYRTDYIFSYLYGYLKLWNFPIFTVNIIHTILFFIVLVPHCFLRAFAGCSQWGYSSLRCTGFFLQCLLLLQSAGSRVCGLPSSRAPAQQLWCSGLSSSTACGSFLHQGPNPCPLHWQVNSNYSVTTREVLHMSLNLDITSYWWCDLGQVT